MQVGNALSVLDQHQERIRRQLVSVLALVEGAEQADGPCDGLAHGRWQMMRLLREYQLFKHVEIFDPVIRSGPPASGRAAAFLKAACVAAGDEYRAHAMRWSAAAVQGDWDAYRRAAARAAAQIERHLIAERAAVVRLLEGRARTRR